MSENAIRPPWWHDEERGSATPSDEEVRALAIKYKLLPGQVRGLIARFGLNSAKLDAEAARLRHR